MTVSIKNREFGKTENGTFEVIETIESTGIVDIESTLLKLKEYESAFKSHPEKIRKMNEENEKVKEYYNTQIKILQDAKKHYWKEYNELVLPELLK